MSDEANYQDMPLTAILKEWLELNEWADPIDVEKDRLSAQVCTRFVIKDQPLQLYFDVDEDAKIFMVTIYTNFLVPQTRMSEVCRLFNFINSRLRLGKFSCREEGKSNPVGFSIGIDVEGGTLSTTQIGTMLSITGSATEQYLEPLAAVALTSQNAETAWRNFQEIRELEQARSKQSSLNLH